MTMEFNSRATEIKADDFVSVTNCLVLAPHPDDESLGCGGLIASLRKEGKEVNVIFITDGSMSHPHSQQYPAITLAALRKEEARQALAVLQVPEKNIFFLNKKDGALPAQGETDFEQNANQLHLLIKLLQPDLILVPYEKDPHRDHRATWQMLMHQRKDIHVSCRILEYIIWLLERGDDRDMPDADSVRYVDITQYQLQKEEAIHKHLSQTTKLITDDIHGFTLSTEMLQRFTANKEYYIDRSL